jgi:hypothetical protein
VTNSLLTIDGLSVVDSAASSRQPSRDSNNNRLIPMMLDRCAHLTPMVLDSRKVAGNMAFWSRAGCLLVVMALTSAPALAAPVVLSTDFQFTLTSGVALDEPTDVPAGNRAVGSGTLQLPAFDSTLGMLTDATIQFDYETQHGASLILSGGTKGSDFGVLLAFEGSYNLRLTDDESIGFTKRIIGGSLQCVAGSGDLGDSRCIAVYTSEVQSFAVEPFSLAAFLDDLTSGLELSYSGWVDPAVMLLGSTIGASVNVNSAITWRGSATVTYHYEPHATPTPVPTPGPFAVLAVAMGMVASVRMSRRSPL